MGYSPNHLSAISGGESGFVRHIWRTNADCPPRMAGSALLSVADGTQRFLRATGVLQIASVRHTCRITASNLWEGGLA